MPIPMNEDRSVGRPPRRALPELPDGMSTFDIDIGAHLFEQSSGNEDLSTAIALGLGIRQVQPDLTARTLVGENEIGGEER